MAEQPVGAQDAAPDRAEHAGDNVAGDGPGDTAGESAVDTAGDSAVDTAGDSAVDTAGDSAVDTAGESAGDGNGSGNAGPVPPTAYPAYLPFPWHPAMPRVVIKADLLPGLSVLSLVSLFGLAVGWLWSRLAPPQRLLVYPDGSAHPLTAESYHRFDDLVLFTLIGLGAGLVTGVAVWYLRERRGPVIMLAATIGAALGGWLATKVGTAWADGRFPAPGNVKVLDVVLKAPELESGWALLAWPLTTALVYGVLAAWNAMDDLGRRLG